VSRTFHSTQTTAERVTCCVSWQWYAPLLDIRCAAIHNNPVYCERASRGVTPGLRGHINLNDTTSCTRILVALLKKLHLSIVRMEMVELVHD
jgi:hypothetical protein